MRTIPLSQGQVALVDDEDYERLSGYVWHITYGPHGTEYAARHISGKHVLMHKVLIPVQKPMEIDHRNNNGLDNRRENLRVCTHAQNRANSTKRGGGSSAFKGVSWFSAGRKWQAYIMKNYQRYHLGYFINEIDAAQAYNEAAQRLFGEFARLNSLGDNTVVQG